MGSIEVLKNIVSKQANIDNEVDPKLLPKEKGCGCQHKKLIMTEK
jgi:hypothetical protein